MNAKSRFINDDFKISQECMDSGWTMPYSHYHVSYEIYILINGERNVAAGDMNYTAKAHDATLFPSNIPHKSSGDTPFSGICIHFSERYLNLYFTANAKKNLMRCFKNNVMHISDEDFNIMKKIADNFIACAPDNFVILSDILNILNNSTPENNCVTATAGQKKGQKKIQLIMDYVEENYVYIKHISDITAAFDVSEAYVFKIYRQKYHMTPKKYINRLRIHNACHRLKHTDNTVKSIALNCGFDNYEYFASVFKETVGLTPTEYRRQNQLKPG